MSGAKHTPGSWTVEDKRSLNDAFWIEVQHPDGYSVSIAEVRDGCDEAAELGCMEANARLIASAPDLLEALVGLMPKRIDLTNANVPDSMVIPCDITFGELRNAAAAITRATGDRLEKGGAL